jgi:hypothetical protein
VVDALLGLLIIGWLGKHNIRNKGLRVAVVEREPRLLHLHHDAVPW